MGEEQIKNLKERTDAKIDYAKLMLSELTERASSEGRGDSLERAHEEAVLFHVIGAKDAFLHEINVVYNLSLKPSEVTESNLASALVKKGDTCPALQKIMRLKDDTSSWLFEANMLRNFGTHRKGLSRTFFQGGEHDDKVFYHDPRNPGKYIAEEDTFQYLKKCIDEMSALIQDLRTTLP